jgi:hypothetical protein
MLKEQRIATINGILTGAGIKGAGLNKAGALYEAMEKGGLLKPELTAPPKVDGVYCPNQAAYMAEKHGFKDRHAFLSGIFAATGLPLASEGGDRVLEGLDAANMIKFENNL